MSRTQESRSSITLGTATIDLEDFDVVGQYLEDFPFNNVYIELVSVFDTDDTLDFFGTFSGGEINNGDYEGWGIWFDDEGAYDMY